MPSATAYVALGANLGDRLQTMREAVRLIRQLPGTMLDDAKGVSSLYETSPQEVTDLQPPYLNAVIRIATALPPHELLAGLSAIEQSLGRIRTHRGASRIIDLDLLLYDDLVFDTPDLILPHPRLHLRRFVLEPLAEIAPSLRHPVTGLTIARQLADMVMSQPGQDAEPVRPPPWHESANRTLPAKL